MNRFRRFLAIVATLLGAVGILGTAGFAVGVWWPLEAPVPNERHGRLIITHVSLVDVVAGAVTRNSSVLVEDGVIAEVGVDHDDAGAVVVDGGGRFLIPGLFDMHVHSIKLSPVLMHPLFIASGVTAVRDMGGCVGIDDGWVACAEDKRGWNRGVMASTVVGPRYDQVTSLPLNGGHAIPRGIELALGGATVEGVRARVARDRARGIDFLKPYNRLPRETYFALAERADALDRVRLAGESVLALE